MSNAPEPILSSVERRRELLYEPFNPMARASLPLAPNHKACLVDLDGTLYRHGPLKIAMAAELSLLGLSALSTLRSFRELHEELRRQEVRGASSPYESQLQATADRLNQPVSKVRQVVERWMIQRPVKWIRLFRRASLLHELARFQQQGGKLGLVSDYPAQAKLAAFEALRFDVVVANGEPGGPTRLKPDPEGYLLAARALSLSPEQCLVIGDRPDADGLAAKRAGMAFHCIR